MASFRSAESECEQLATTRRCAWGVLVGGVEGVTCTTQPQAGRETWVLHGMLLQLVAE